jgi:energy-coupling factor transporter ATP-binding protein EcfA2
MRLTTAHVRNFKSIEDGGPVAVDESVTVLVGQNESGKTAFLKALHKADPVEGKTEESFDVIEDYPRRRLTAYQQEHVKNPAPVVTLTYALDDEEIAAVNEDLGFDLLTALEVTHTHKYDNSFSVGISVDEASAVTKLLAGANLTTETGAAAKVSTTVRELIELLGTLDLNTEEQAFLKSLADRYADPKSSWASLVALYVWKHHVAPNVPKFLYFDDYMLLPGKVNLTALQARAQNPATLTNEDKTVLALLRLAQISLVDVSQPDGYEKSKAQLEGISNAITDKIFAFWTQNRELEVEFDIKADPKDQPPFNSGSNLYIRIKNRRHRVTVPFDQRSKGFIWFFSFLVWFDSVREGLGAKSDLVLLLDEPGLSLHALAQADFLRYIDDLSAKHQILYTSHSPFMIHSGRLHQVRTVEDKPTTGTIISDNVSGSDPKTIFPLQAALGYTIAQNLFISTRNLLVEGPADLVYLKYASSLLEQAGRTALRDDVTLVPVGGLDKLSTFVALLHGNKLEIVILHDFSGQPDNHLENLIREKLIRERQVLHYGRFRTATKGSSADVPADIEDLLTPAQYLELFSATYKKELAGKKVTEADLPGGDRMVDRLNRYLSSNAITLRASGGFNHYRVANHLASHPVAFDAATLDRFEVLFTDVNARFE